MSKLCCSIGNVFQIFLLDVGGGTFFVYPVVSEYETERWTVCCTFWANQNLIVALNCTICWPNVFFFMPFYEIRSLRPRLPKCMSSPGGRLSKCSSFCPDPKAQFLKWPTCYVQCSQKQSPPPLLLYSLSGNGIPWVAVHIDQKCQQKVAWKSTGTWLVLRKHNFLTIAK